MEQKGRPILFNGQMVRAIIEGRKTQTRRIVGNMHQDYVDVDDGRGVVGWVDNCTGREVVNYPKRCPYGQPGDRLWVRETWGQTIEDTVCYRADEPMSIVTRWRPSIHMPRWASRITLEVVAVRVERLQDISEEDAISEGVEDLPFAYGYPVNGKTALADSAESAFKNLWESINGPGSWGENPWVWVIEFRQVQ